MDCSALQAGRKAAVQDAPGRRGARAPLGVAVVGLGIGEQHARAYRALPACRVRALYDLDAARAEAVRSSIGAGETVSSYEDILADPSVDLVSIASYDDAHFGQVVRALEAGKHVFVEKPLCRTLGELRRIKEAWQRGGGALKLTSNLVLRAAPLYRWLRAHVARGALGQPYAFDGEYLYGRLHKITDGWRGGIADYSVVLGGGIHLADLMLWVLGERPSTVWAAGNGICTRGTAFRTADFVTATLRFPSGALGRLTANFGCVHRHQHVVRVYGTEATFLYDAAGARLHKARDPRSAPRPIEAAPLPESKGALIAPFVEAILAGEALEAQAQHVFDTISVCLACEASLAAGEEVAVEYV